MKTIILPLVVLSTLLSPVAASGQETGYRPQVGEPHPQVVLPRIDTRETGSLSEYRGKKVLLIHFASW